MDKYNLPVCVMCNDPKIEFCYKFKEDPELSEFSNKYFLCEKTICFLEAASAYHKGVCRYSDAIGIIESCVRV